MKRSNLFLGATTALLAVASFAFAKTNHKSIPAHCLTLGTPNTCAPVTNGSFIVTAGSPAAKCHGVNAGKTVVTAACVQALKVGIN